MSLLLNEKIATSPQGIHEVSIGESPVKEVGSRTEKQFWEGCRGHWSQRGGESWRKRYSPEVPCVHRIPWEVHGSHDRDVLRGSCVNTWNYVKTADASCWNGVCDSNRTCHCLMFQKKSFCRAAISPPDNFFDGYCSQNCDEIKDWKRSISSLNKKVRK